MKREQDGAIITQFDYPTCEALGLIKMDFLGLRNLTILDDALINIKANRGETIVLEDLALDDPPTYELLARGDTLGVFQLDGGPMRSLLRLMKPGQLRGHLRRGRAVPARPDGRQLAHQLRAAQERPARTSCRSTRSSRSRSREILGDTYGLIVYQEQVMAIAQKLAGYTLGQADLLRRAMGKKKKSELDKQFAGFSQGMQDNGYSMAAVKTLWDILLPFSDYAFNKAHTAAYGVVSYWTGVPQGELPGRVHGRPAHLRSATTRTSRRSTWPSAGGWASRCCRPTSTSRRANFTPVGTDIRFGLAAIRNVGENVVEAIVAAARPRGAFTDFDDFLRKVDAVVCNKRTVESLIKAGAFDSLGHRRRGLLLDHEHEVDSVVELKRAEEKGQYSLFAAGDSDDGSVPVVYTEPNVAEWDKATLLAFEREMLGLYVSDHPLNGLEPASAAADRGRRGRRQGPTRPARRRAADHRVRADHA